MPTLNLLSCPGNLIFNFTSVLTSPTTQFWFCCLQSHRGDDGVAGHPRRRVGGADGAHPDAEAAGRLQRLLPPRR